jgi:hypothetical protein
MTEDRRFRRQARNVRSSTRFSRLVGIIPSLTDLRIELAKLLHDLRCQEE